LGFRAGERKKEANWIFDDAKGSLRRQGRLLRLRQSGGRWLLTVKGPRLPGLLKRRSEAETPLADGPACRRALELLGYQARMIYRRHRTVFERAGEPGEIAWDETPMGVYLEIEGSAAWVRRTAAALGLDPARAEPRSYPELYAAGGSEKRRATTARPPKARTSPARPRPSAASKRPTARDGVRRG
jgi:adenylate cyclase class 2